jgi:hypothetical protein
VPYVANIDTTGKPLYGSQKVNLRLVTNIEVAPGKRSAARHVMPGVWRFLDSFCANASSVHKTTFSKSNTPPERAKTSTPAAPKPKRGPIAGNHVKPRKTENTPVHTQTRHRSNGLTPPCGKAECGNGLHPIAVSALTFSTSRETWAHFYEKPPFVFSLLRMGCRAFRLQGSHPARPKPRRAAPSPRIEPSVLQ